MYRPQIKNQEELKDRCAEIGVSLPYNTNTSKLADPIKLGKKVAPNRVVYQPMEGCDGELDGTPGELTIRRYMRFAAGAPGIIWFEATAVLPEARANPRQLYITEENLDSFKKIVEDIKAEAVKKTGREPLIICQLTHSGRYSKPNGKPEPLIAYNNPIFEKDNPIPESQIVSDDYLDKVGDYLVKGASLAEKAGFDGADIKSCHRYLLSELLSAYNREGRFGGSFENRTSPFLRVVKEAAANRSGDFLITSRLNIYDGFPYPYGFGVTESSGITPVRDEGIRLVKAAKEAGADFLNITMGNPYVNPHVNRPYASGGYEPPEDPLFGVYRMLDGIRLAHEAVPDFPIVSSGLSYLGNVAPAVAAACIESGWFDMAGWGRQTLANPTLAEDIIKNGAINPKECCLTCGKCTEIMRTPGGTPGCAVRDTEVYTPIYRKMVLKK